MCLLLEILVQVGKDLDLILHLHCPIKMFVINPDPYSLPSYRIGPFTTRDISLNNKLPESEAIDKYFKDRFNRREFVYSINGRSAINTALSYYKLNPEDIVTILTTSGNFYISSCVTHEIEKFCKWSREIESHTRVILVNHEFGYPYSNMQDLKKSGIPIIEDCAHSFFSLDSDHLTGSVGDFAIYSFPKMFPLQIGGLLSFKPDINFNGSETISTGVKQYIKNVLSFYIENKDQIINQRLLNYKYLTTEFGRLGFSERFELLDGVVPGVFMFRKREHIFNLPELKQYFYAHGIQCSVFYGEESFFLPVHQSLGFDDLDYFVNVINSFINR